MSGVTESIDLSEMSSGGNQGSSTPVESQAGTSNEASDLDVSVSNFASPPASLSPEVPTNPQAPSRFKQSLAPVIPQPGISPDAGDLDVLSSNTESPPPPPPVPPNAAAKCKACLCWIWTPCKSCVCWIWTPYIAWFRSIFIPCWHWCEKKAFPNKKQFNILKVILLSTFVFVLIGHLSRTEIRKYFWEWTYTAALVIYGCLLTLFGKRGYYAKSFWRTNPKPNRRAKSDKPQSPEKRESAREVLDTSRVETHAPVEVQHSTDVHGIFETSAMERGESSRRFEDEETLPKN